MSSLCFYFQIHQPFRLRTKYSFFEIGIDHLYEDSVLNRDICNKVSKNCYIPATRKMLDLVEKFKGKFKISFSITGTALEQFQQFNPEVIELLKNLSQSGCVEFIAETYYHSLAFLFSLEELRQQTEKHKNTITELFGVNPVTFRNTELVYSNAIALEAKNMGFKNIFAEGADNLLGQLSPCRLYSPKGLLDINLLLRNYRLSDDIALRFSEKKQKKHPLTAKKYVRLLSDALSAGAGAAASTGIVNLFMDYETLGEHHSAKTGILDFFEDVVSTVINKTDMEFIMPKEVSQKHKHAGEIDAPDNTSWQGNAMQKSSLNMIYKIEKKIKTLDDKNIIHIWRKLQTSDHFYCMSTKGFKDGDAHKYFNYFATPYDAYIVYTNIVNDLCETIKKM